MNRFDGQCELIDGIFFSILNEVITDLVPFVAAQVPAVVETKQQDQKIDPRVKFVYFGNRSQASNHEGVITIASYVDECSNRAYYGVSYCSPSDVYDKKKGKLIAYERLCTGENSVGFNKKNHVELTTRIMASIFADNQYPSWAKDTIDYEAYSLLCAF